MKRRITQLLRETVRQNYLRPLMREGGIVMTRPDEPNDPQQAYRAAEEHIVQQRHADSRPVTTADGRSRRPVCSEPG